MKSDATNAIARSCILISGAEDVLRRRLLAETLSGANADEFDQEVVLGDQTSFADVIGSAGTAPFLSDRRVVVVRQALRLSLPPNAGEMLAALPETALVIFVTDEEPAGDDSKQRDRDSAGKALVAAIKAAKGTLLTAAIDDPKKMKDRLRDDARAMGKSISAVATETLAEMCGGDYSRSFAELEKLALFSGESGEIRESDVKLVVTPSRSWNVFRLVDTVVAGDVSGALAQLKTLAGTASQSDEAANRTILPMMARQFKLLWQARSALDQKKAVMDLKSTWPSKPNLATERDWIQNRTVQAARRIKIDSIERCLRLLAQADAKLKGVQPSLNAFETLELLVLECCDAVKLVPACSA